ncbi:hypothetical protein ES703_76371 [subsurface metagenome]
MTSEIVDNIIRLKSQGLTIEQISISIGFPATLISKILNTPMARKKLKKKLKEKKKKKIKIKKISKLKKEQTLLLQKHRLDLKFDLICFNNHKFTRKGEDSHKRLIFIDYKCNKTIKFYYKFDMKALKGEFILECCNSQMEMLSSSAYYIFYCPFCKFKLKLIEKLD